MYLITPSSEVFLNTRALRGGGGLGMRIRDLSVPASLIVPCLHRTDLCFGAKFN